MCGGEAVDDQELVLCCACPCLNCSCVPGCACIGCSALVSLMRSKMTSSLPYPTRSVNLYFCSRLTLARSLIYSVACVAAPASSVARSAPLACAPAAVWDANVGTNASPAVTFKPRPAALLSPEHCHATTMSLLHARFWGAPCAPARSVAAVCK